MSTGPSWSASAAALGRRCCTRLHPDRVEGVVAVAPWILDDTPPLEHRLAAALRFDDELDSYEGWYSCNRHVFETDWPAFPRFFFDQMLPEPHSTKQLEDVVGFACETTGQVMLAEYDMGKFPVTRDQATRTDQRFDRAGAGHPGHR